MRFSILLLLATASIIYSLQIECLHDDFESLENSASCRKDVIMACLQKQAISPRLEEIEYCFLAGGCTTKDALFYMEECNIRGLHQDLKKRQRRATDDDPPTTQAPAIAAKPTSAKAPPATEAKTTEGSNRAELKQRIPATTPAATSNIPSTTISAASVTESSSIAPGQCYVTKQIKTKTCTTQTESGNKRTCFKTTVPTLTCAPNMICFPTFGGPDKCSRSDDKVPTEGIVIALIFGLAITGVTAALIVSSVQARNKTRRDRLARDHQLSAEAPAKPYRIGTGGELDFEEPLIQGGAAMGYSSGPPANVPPLPQIQLHPGLGAVDQSHVKPGHWSDGYNVTR